MARNCEELAAKINDAESKERLLGIASGWTHLATVLETTEEIVARFGRVRELDREKKNSPNCV
jgi:hypothetical protein